MITYIIKTKQNEYYCGKTTNLLKRIHEHLNEKKPHWFGFKNRKEFEEYFHIEGDFEKRIKKFGVAAFYKMVENNFKYEKIEVSTP